MMTDVHPKAEGSTEENPGSASRIWTDLDLDKDGKAFGYLRVNISNKDRDTGFPIPIAVFNNGPGPRILILGGVHGDEIEGQVMTMKLMRSLDIENVKGHIIIMSATNAPAAYAGSRTSPLDDGNLNRSYPGNPDGTPTQEIAYFIENVLLRRVDYLLDFHSGGLTDYITPSAHVYHSDDKEKFARLVRMLRVFGMPTTVIKKAIGACDRKGVLRFATELGGGGYITVKALRQAEHGLARDLYDLGALRKPITDEPPPQTELVRRLPNRQYVYAMATGLFEPYVEINEEVAAGQAAGAIHFPEEPWRTPWIATFQEGGTIHGVRTRAHTLLGDTLFMLHVPWKE
jgi:predicted deacylase